MGEADGVTGTDASVRAAIRASLTPELLKPEFARDGAPSPAGHCYAASEAYYHLMGGKEAGLKPMGLKHEGVSYWFVRDTVKGENIDLTAGQFSTPVPYGNAGGRGFLTKEPSARARVIMARVESALGVVPGLSEFVSLVRDDAHSRLRSEFDVLRTSGTGLNGELASGEADHGDRPGEDGGFMLERGNGVNHDYDPSWDYAIDKKPPAIVTAAVERNWDEMGRAAKLLGVNAPAIHYVRGLTGGHLARFISGTSGNPVMVMDARAVQRGAREYDVDIDTAVRTTLLHELGHAYVESVGAELPNEEDVVEDFAHTTWDDGTPQYAAEDLIRTASGEALYEGVPVTRPPGPRRQGRFLREGLASGWGVSGR